MQKTVTKKKDESRGTWEELYRLGEEIGSGWVAPQSLVEILSEMRR